MSETRESHGREVILESGTRDAGRAGRRMGRFAGGVEEWREF